MLWKWLTTIVRELLGLFIDDGAFALAILAWLVLAALCRTWLLQARHLGGPLLFAGLAILLVASAGWYRGPKP